MLQFLKTSCLLALSLIFSGCTTVPVIDSDFAAEKHTVGIIALVDKHTTRQYVGTDQFDKRTESVHLDNLDLQTTILNVAREDLALAGIDTKAIDPGGLPPFLTDMNHRWLQNLAQSHGVDFLIFITPTSSSNFIVGNHHVLRGHGLYYQAHPELASNTVAYYSGRILSYNLKTGIWGGQTTATAQTSASGHQHLYRDTSAPQNNQPHHEFDHFASLDEQELDYIRSTLHQVTRQAVRQMLSQLPINRTLSASTR